MEEEDRGRSQSTVGPGPMGAVEGDLTTDEVVKNVERMLKREDAAAKA